MPSTDLKGAARTKSKAKSTPSPAAPAPDEAAPDLGEKQTDERGFTVRVLTADEITQMIDSCAHKLLDMDGKRALEEIGDGHRYEGTVAADHLLMLRALRDL